MELKALEEREKNKNALKFRITFFFVFFLAAVFAVFVFTSVLQVNTVTRFICSHYAQPAIEKAQKLINAESFERLSKTMDSSDPYYTETQQKLFEIKKETNCQYLYTMAQKKETKFYYIIDGSDVPGGEDFSALGAEEDLGYWDKAAYQTFITGKGQMGTIDRNDEYGATISVYEPILAKSGAVIGLLACDVNASEIVQWVRTQVVWELSIVLIMLVVGLVVYLTLIRLVNKSFS